MDPTNEERVSHVKNIANKLYKLARKGDEIALGMDGDPLFPASYRGSSRPTGTIVSIEQSDGDGVAVVHMKDGSERTFYQHCYSPKNIWELTDNAYRGLKRRLEPHRATSPKARSSDEFRGSASSSGSMDTQKLEQKIHELSERVETLRYITFQSLKGLANDISQPGSDHKFAGSLARQMANYSPQYRGHGDRHSQLPHVEDGSSDDDDFE